MVLKDSRLFGRAFIGIALIVALLAPLAGSQTVRERADIAPILRIKKLSAQDRVVAREIHNRSLHGVREVTLFIRHTWLRNQEFKPGKNDPGRSSY